MKKIDADGNCFFRAVSFCLRYPRNGRTGCDIPHEVIRRELVTYMEDNMERYMALSGIDDALEFYRQLEFLTELGNWNCNLADLLPKACSEFYGLRLDIQSKNAKTNQKIGRMTSPLVKLVLDGSHYDVVD